MTITAILHGKGHHIVVAAPDDPVRQAVALLAEHRIGAVPVVDGDTVVGVFSERDLVYCLRAGDTAVLDRPVREVMTAPAVTVTPADAVMGALSLMTRRRIRHLPVVEGGRMIGLVSIGDLVKYRIERVEADAAAMRDYIQQA
jgi:CBS domain-containing protein